jgi:hypothetical protein
MLGGYIMQKLALLLGAALVVSLPLAATVSTDTYAAAKAKKAAKQEAKKAETSPDEANSRFFRALDDLGRGLATYSYTYDPAGGGGGGKDKGKAKKGKKG